MRRREFTAAGCAMAAPWLARSAARASPQDMIPARKLQRLAISTSTYRANYDGKWAIDSAMPRLSHLTFPRYVMEKFGIRHVELWDQQFGALGHTEEQCRLIRAAADAVGSTIVSVEVEDLPRIDQTDPAARADVLTQIRTWLEKGRILGAGSMRFNVTRGHDPANVEAAADTLREAAQYGRSIGVRVLLENHGGYTANIADMIALVRAVNDDFCRIEIDWGAWSPPGDRYQALQSAMPYVHIVSAKGEVFDEATYEHTNYDIGRIVRNAEAGGFAGLYSIELWNSPAPKDTDRAVRSFMNAIAGALRA